MVPPKDPCERSGALFRETRWTWIDEVRGGSESERKIALESLCSTYRLPLYCYARKRGLDPDDANDVVQDCLAELIRRNTFAKADQTKGRLRTFLLINLQQQISNWQRREQAQKRGGKMKVLSLERDAEDFCGREPVDDQSPDKIFARTWAKVISDSVVKRLRENWDRRAQSAQFEALRPFLFEQLGRTDTTRLATELGISVANTRVKLHRLRKEFVTQARAIVAETVPNIDEIDDELRELRLHSAGPANRIL